MAMEPRASIFASPGFIADVRNRRQKRTINGMPLSLSRPPVWIFQAMSKVEKLCAAYENFANAIAEIPDELVRRLHGTSANVRAFVVKARTYIPKPTPSQIASGLEQGWRETPILIQGVDREWRSIVSRAWNDATLQHYPEFFTKENQLLQKILDREKIRGEREYYRIRHEIDILEGESGKQATLMTLYSLVEAYESVGKSR